jgi:MHS family shikimate/dehydroshikimate transporter-like MFS transporter
MKQNINRVTFASAFGTMFEWYDFLIFGIATVLVFNKLFFPNLDPAVAILASLLTFSVGFIARPLGGILFGHYGDRIGRKNTLMVTMLLMGLATFAIGLLPTYDTIGIWAPVLLVVLRLLQGLAFGGEWGGASIMILECAPANRRGFYGSFIQMGFPLGLLTSTGIFALVSMLPTEEFLSWGWRIPFLISIILVAIGTFVRSQLTETPVFQQLQEQKKIVRTPFLETLISEPRSLLLGIGLKITEVALSYVLTVFVVSYAVNNMGVPRGVIMNAVLIATTIMVVTLPLFGYISDIIGRRRIYIIGGLITIVLSWPIFMLIANGWFITSMILGLVVCCSTMMAPLAAYLPELFNSNVRFTGASFGCQVAAALGGGVAPILAAWLATLYGLPGIAVLMIVLGVVTLISAYYANETVEKDLT